VVVYETYWDIVFHIQSITSITKVIIHQGNIKKISDFLTYVYFSDYDHVGSCKTKVFKSFCRFCG